MSSFAGSGKSVALAALAEWGRASGRLVVYVPSASLFMDGGFFHKCGTGPADAAIYVCLIPQLSHLVDSCFRGS